MSTRALIARINRRLAKDNMHLRSSRGLRTVYHDVGRYIVIDGQKKVLVDSDADLGYYVEHTGALAEWETWKTDE